MGSSSQVRNKDREQNMAWIKLPIFGLFQRGWFLELSIFPFGVCSKLYSCPRKWRVVAMLHSDQISDPFVTLYYIYTHTQFRNKKQRLFFFGKEFVSLSFQILGSIFQFCWELDLQASNSLVCREHSGVVSGFRAKFRPSELVNLVVDNQTTTQRLNRCLPLKDMIVYARTVGRHSGQNLILWSNWLREFSSLSSEGKVEIIVTSHYCGLKTWISRSVFC